MQLGIQIQIEGLDGWTRIKTRFSNIVMGGVYAGKWKSQLIPAGKGHDFYLGFAKDDFEVQRGQRLRVIVKAWRDEPSMRAQKPPIQLTTAPFECP